MLRFLIQSHDNLAGVTNLSIGLQIILVLFITVCYIIMPFIMITLLKSNMREIKEYYICDISKYVCIIMIIIFFIILCISSIHHNIFTLC